MFTSVTESPESVDVVSNNENRLPIGRMTEMTCDIYELLGFPALSLNEGQTVTDVFGNGYKVCLR